MPKKHQKTDRVNRRRANKTVRSNGLAVRGTRVDADEFSMDHKGSKLVDLHGVDTITAAEILKAVTGERNQP